MAIVERWSMATGHAPAPWLSALIGVCVIAVLVELVVAFRTRPRSVSAGRALAVSSLRLLALGSLLAVAFEWTIRFDEVATRSRRIVILADRSASMAVADAATPSATATTRQNRMEDIWGRSQSAMNAWRTSGLKLDIRHFADGLTPDRNPAKQGLHTVPTGTASALGAALRRIAEDQQRSGEPAAAVVVLSDGLVTPEHSGQGPDPLVHAAREIGAPITTVAVGAPGLIDAAISRVRVGDFAFVENVTELSVDLVSHGLKGTTSDVELWKNGEKIRSHPIIFGDDGKTTQVQFSFVPDRVGHFVYEVVLPTQPQEATADNNSRAFVVKILRDKIRVLHVAGRPDWDVRALRSLLRGDPNVELLSYYILRDFDDIAREDSDALSLIPFPTEELFDEELGSFDVVILHNFDAVPHQVAEYVDNIAKFVTDGGGLVLIGGDLGLSDGGYATASMARILPFDVRRPSYSRHEPFRPELTEAGRTHPITQWLRDQWDGSWAALPELDEWNPVPPNPGLRDRSAILLAHPTQTDPQGRAYPILAVAEAEKGRVVAIASGATWRLGFADEVARLGSTRPYDLLWLGVMRWLLRDETSARLQLETDKTSVPVGQSVSLVIHSKTASYDGEANIPVSWDLRRLNAQLGGLAQPAPSGTATTDDRGRAVVELTDLPRGAYVATAKRIVASTTPSESSVSATRVFIVETANAELSDLDAAAGTERLRQLAKATNGAFVDAAADDTLPVNLPTSTDPGSETELLGRRQAVLWSNPAALLLMLIGFTGEWWLRRRLGYR